MALNILLQEEMWFGWGREIGLVGIFEIVARLEFVIGRSEICVVKFGASLTSWD